MKLFSGTANPSLTTEVAQLMNVPVSKSEVVRFENTEVRVRIEEDVKNNKCVVMQSTSNPMDANLMELFLTCDALRREEAHKVIGVLPYFGYARQNIQHRNGECVSANMIIRILETIGFNKVYTFDLHDEATAGVFSIPFVNLTTLGLIAENVKSYLGADATKEKVTVISPDQGGIERARKFGTYLFGDDKFSIGVTEKKRNADQIHQSKALDLYGDVAGKTAIIVDDVTTSGGTLIHAAEFCMQKGATRVLAAIVHHDFGPTAAQKIQDSSIEKFFTTNTIALKENQQFEKMVEISVAPLMAEELKFYQELG